MFRQQPKQLVEKLVEIVDFRFLQFHARKVPKGWDKLVVTVISVETGKAIARTNKAVVRGGSCKWLEDVSESVRFLQDDNSRELEEKLYKFVVSMGSARLGILGEATVNLSDYLNSKDLVWIQLPLKKCNHGTILHVKIQCLTPISGSRETELWSETITEQVEQISVFDEADDRSEGSNNESSFRTQRKMESKARDVDYLAGISRPELDSLEELSATNSAVKGYASGDQASSLSIKNGLPRRQRSAGPQNGNVKYKPGNGLEQYGSKSFDENDSGTVEYPRNRSFGRATSGSHGIIQNGMENVNKGARVGGLASGNGSSNEFLEAAELTIQELQKDSITWERKAQNSILETEILKQQLAEQQRQHREMEMQFLTMQSERDSFKQEVEQLKSALQDYIESEKGENNARFEAQNARHMIKEFEDEIKLHKESNANLSLQLGKVQEANTELVFALQELEETIEQKNVEIEKLLVGRNRIHDVDISEQEVEELRYYAESGVKFSNIVAERDNLKKEIEQLTSSLEQGIDSIQRVEMDVKYSVAELQEDSKATEYKDASPQDLQRYLEILKQDMNELEKDCKELTDENLELIYSLKKLTKSLESKNLHIAELEEKLRVSSFDSTLAHEGYIDTRINNAPTETDGQKAQVNDLDKLLESSKLSYSTEVTGMEVVPYDSQNQVMEFQDHNSGLGSKLNALKKKIHELGSENACDKNVKNEKLAASCEHQLDAHDNQATKAEQELASAIQKIKDLELKNSNDTIFIDGLKVLVAQLNKKVEMSQYLHSTELNTMKRSLKDFESQVLELQNQKLDMVNIFKNRVHNLEREVVTTQQGIIEREVELIVAYESQLECNESRIAKTVKEGASALQRIQTLEDEKTKLSVEINGLNDHISELEEKLKWSEDSYRAEITNNEKLLSDFKNQIMELQNQNHTLQGELNALKDRICDLESEVQAAEQKVLERENEVKAVFEYKLQTSEARAMKAELDLADARANVKFFENSIAKDVSMIDELKMKIIQLQQKLKSSEDVHSMQLAVLEKSLRDFQNQVMKLQNENSILENEATMLKDKLCEVQNESQKAQQEAIDREEDLSVAFEQRLKTTEIRVKEAEDELAEALKSIFEHDIANDVMYKIISEQQKQVMAVEDQAAKVHDELVFALKTIEDLEGDKERISLDLSNECRRRQIVENATSSLDQLNKELKTSLQNIEAKHLEASLQFCQLEETNLQLQKRLDSCILVEKCLRENISQLEIVKMKLHSEIENLQEEGHSSKLCIQDLNCHISELMVEIQSLRCSNQDLDMKATKLQRENVDLKDKVNAAQKESNSAGECLQDLRKLLEPLTANAESNSLAKKNFEKRIMELQHGKDEFEIHMKEVKDKNVHLVKQVHCLEMQLNYTEEERDSLRRDLENAKATCFNLQAETKLLELELREENKKLMQTLHESQRELSGTLEELACSKTEQQLLEHTKEQIEQRAMELQHNKEEIENHLKEAEETNVYLLKQVDKLEMQLNNMAEERDYFRLELENIGATYFNLQAEMKVLEVELKGENGKLLQTLHESHRQLSKTLEEIGSFKGKQKLLEHNKEEVEQKAMELQHSKGENENHLKEMEEEIVNLLEQVHGLEMQLNNVAEERDSFRIDLENTKATCFSLQGEMKVLEHQLREENEKLLHTLHETQNYLSGTLEELGSCKRERQLLEHTKEETEQRAMELQHSKKKIERHLNEIEEKNGQLLKQVDSLETQLNKTAEERDYFRLDLENSRATCFNLQTEMKVLEKLREEIATLLQALHESQKELSGTLEELGSSRREQQLLELTLENLRREHTTAMELKPELKEKSTNLFESPANVEQHLQKVTEDLSVSFSQIKSLESDLSRLQRNMIGKKCISAPNTETNEHCIPEYEENGEEADEAVGQEYSEKENAVESLQNEVQSLTRQVYLALDEEERMLTEALTEVSDLRAAKKNLEDSLQLNQEKVKQTESELLYVKQECESKVQDLKLELENSRKKEEDLHFKLGLMHRQLEDMKVKEAYLQERVKEIEMKVSAVENEKKKVKDENSSLSVQVNQLMSLRVESLETNAFKSIVEDIREERNTLQEAFHSIESELERLKAENVLLMEKLAAIKQGIPASDKEEKILSLQGQSNAKGVEQRNKSVQLQSLRNHFQQELHDLQEEKDKHGTESNFQENKLQLEVNVISKSEEISSATSDCKVGCTYPSQDTDQVTKLNDRIHVLENKLENQIKEFEEKEEVLITEIQKLEDLNQHLMQAKLDSETDQLRNELLRLQNQNSALSQKQSELLSKLRVQELFQQEVCRLQEVNKQLETQLTRFKETVKGGDILERVVVLETELAEALEANSMYKLQLERRQISTLEEELNDMRERYSSLSLKLAEVEVQREELVMTIKHAKYGKRWYGMN